MTSGRAAVFNEIEVRAAAGLTMVVGAVAFAYAYFDKQYVPLQVVASLFWWSSWCASRSACASARSDLWRVS
jgi:hypothetical protein